MQEQARVTAAIMAAIDRFEEEEMLAGPAMPRPAMPQIEMSYWKYWGLAETMRMRISWQLGTCAVTPLKRR
jgi:hypothetical protein